MLKKISLETYQNEPNGARKELWKQNILEALKDAPNGSKKHFKSANNDVDVVMRQMYASFLAEKAVLAHLQKMMPDQNWRFVDPDSAGYYLMYYIVTNKPDLINDAGITVEVKNTTIYNDKIYFTTPMKTIDGFWEKKLHAPNYVVVYDRGYAICLTKDDIINNIIEEMPAKDDQVTYVIRIDKNKAKFI